MDPHGYVRETAVYAVWAATRRRQLRVVLSDLDLPHPDGAAAPASALLGILARGVEEDNTRVATESAEALACIAKADREDGGKPGFQAQLQSLIPRAIARGDALGGEAIAAKDRFSLRDALDRLVAQIAEGFKPVDAAVARALLEVGVASLGEQRR